MSQFTQKKCPTCGGRLELVTDKQYECRCCHNVYTMNEENTSLYDALQTASVFRESLNFKQAEMLYKNMLKKYADDDLSDVYWNLLLCEQRVMFETDQNGEQFPSFYDISATEIDESEYYGKAMEYAQEHDTSKLMCFVDLANKMQEAKAKYRTIKNSTKPYEIFICFKKSDLLDPTRLTPDYNLAYDLYNHLSKDYNVFFSEKSLDNIVISEYEPNIYHALYTSKIMLVICSDINYLNSQWVKNEWSRFKMMTRTSATAKRIIPIFTNGFNPEQLPEELRSCQGLNADIHLMERLSTNVKSVLNPVDREAELAAKLKADMQAQMEAFAKQFTSTAPQNSATLITPVAKTKIEDMEFLNRLDITLYDIPSGVTHIGVEAFQGCTNLAHVTVPDTVIHVGNDAFRNCKSLSNIDLPDSVKTIGDTAFYGCSRLINIKLPKSLTQINLGTFYGCTNLKEIIIPETVLSISRLAFEGCANPLTLFYQGTKSQWEAVHKDSDDLVAPKFIVKFALQQSAAPTQKPAHASNPSSAAPTRPNYIVPMGTTEIKDKQFRYNSDVKEAIIPQGVNKIGISAFEYCKNLSKVAIPNSVKVIEESAFSYCTNLKNIVIPDGVVSIGDKAFTVSNIARITIGHNVRSIGYKVFSLCNKLTDIYYKGTIAEWRKIDKATGNFLKGSWNSGTLEYTVHCTDGDLSKKQS